MSGTMHDSKGGNPERQLGGVDFILHRAAELYPDRIAIDDRLNGSRVTYAELRRRAIQLARALESLGVRKGDVIASAFRNEAMAIEVLFACCMLGAVNAPINTRLATAEAREYLDRIGAVAFVGLRALHSFVEGTGVRHTVLRGESGSALPVGARDYETFFTAQSGDPFPARANWGDPYFICMTGGTTGGSKGVVCSHAGCLLDMLAIANHWTIRNGYRALCCAPVYHAAGLSWACMPVLWQGGTLVFPASVAFDPAAFLRIVAEEGIDTFFIVPAMVAPLHEKWDGVPMTGLKSIALASAPVPRPLRVKVAEMFPAADALVCYGMTECLTITSQQARDFLQHGESSGEPALTARVRILDDAGLPVPRGTPGNVVTRTFAQALRYQNDPANTAATFRPCPGDPEALDWLYTGDVGFLDEGGRITLLDRAKDIIISGGENVASSEFEAVLALHARVRECAVIGLADEKWGEMVCAVIVAADGTDERGLAQELLALCRARLAGYKAPKRFVFTAALPRSAFGKVLKRDLRGQVFTTTFDAGTLRA